MSQIEINGKKYDSIEDYLAGVESIPEIHNWVRTGDNIKCEHCNTSLTIGQKLNYTTKGGTGSSSISAEKAGGSFTGAKKSIKVALANSNIKLQIAIGGIPKTQTISKDSDTKWVVLGVEDSNKNGTNETLLLTTQNPTTETIRMYGYQPYNYVIEEINRMCKEIYGEDARGMTVEDVNSCFQYTAPAGTCGKYKDHVMTYYTVPASTKISDLGPSYENIWTDIQKDARVIDGTKKYFTPNCPEGITDSSVIGNIMVNGYEYAGYSTASVPAGMPVLPDSTTNTTKNLIFGETKNYIYWLASRGIGVYSIYTTFGPNSVENGYVYSTGGLFDSKGFSRNRDYSLRAVIFLRSDIPAVVE